MQITFNFLFLSFFP